MVFEIKKRGQEVQYFSCLTSKRGIPCEENFERSTRLLVLLYYRTRVVVESTVIRKLIEPLLANHTLFAVSATVQQLQLPRFPIRK